MNQMQKNHPVEKGSNLTCKFCRFLIPTEVDSFGKFWWVCKKSQSTGYHSPRESICGIFERGYRTEKYKMEVLATCKRCGVNKKIVTYDSARANHGCTCSPCRSKVISLQNQRRKATNKKDRVVVAVEGCRFTEYITNGRSGQRCFAHNECRREDDERYTRCLSIATAKGWSGWKEVKSKT